MDCLALVVFVVDKALSDEVLDVRFKLAIHFLFMILLHLADSLLVLMAEIC